MEYIKDQSWDHFSSLFIINFLLMTCQIKIVNVTTLFADYSKISSLNGEMDINKLQNDLFAAGDWCRTLVMRLNVEKYKVMHFGKSNPKQVYCMKDSAGNENGIKRNES